MTADRVALNATLEYAAKLEQEIIQLKKELSISLSEQNGLRATLHNVHNAVTCGSQTTAMSMGRAGEPDQVERELKCN